MRHSIIEEDLRGIAARPHPWEEFCGRTILVCGATGLIGSYLVEFLTYLNEQGLVPPLRVLALARDGAKLAQRFSHLAGRDDYLAMPQDVCNSPPLCGTVDFIVHAASEASPKHYLVDPVGTARANVIGTINLLELAKNSGARMLLVSSGAVYGSGDFDVITETSFGPSDPLDPRACYAESKRMAETLCAAYGRQHGVKNVIARISHTYGPGVELDDGRVFADFVADVVAGRNIHIEGNGVDRRPFCYISDTTAALLLLLLRGESGNAYNVGVDQEMSIQDLANLLSSLFPQRNIGITNNNAPTMTSKAARSQGHFDLAKILALGWKPEVSTKDGFRRMINYNISKPTGSHIRSPC